MGGMKRIALNPPPLTIFGKPFVITDFRQTTNAYPYKCAACGNEGTTEQPVLIEKASLIDLLEMLIISTPRDRLSMQDSINANAFIQQASNKDNGFLQLDDGIHKWILKQVYEFAPKVYGVNAAAIQWALENEEKPEPKRK